MGGDGIYGDALNWDTSLVPAATEDIAISSGIATNTGNLLRNAVTTISGTGSLVVNGRFQGGGTMNLSDSGNLSVTGNYLLVGNQSRGVFTQTGGTVNATLDRGFFLSDNTVQAGSEYHLDGGTLSVVNYGTGADPALYAVHIGKGGTNDLFSIDGGTATFSAETTSRNVWISRDSTFQLLEGSATFAGYEAFTIGRFGAVTGTSELLISGGDFSVTNLLNSFTLGQDDHGLVTLSGGTMTIGSTILLGGGAATSGTFEMSGGMLTASDIFAGAGAAFFNFTGGEIFLGGNRTAILDEPWFAEVAGTQAVYDAASDMTRIAVVPEPSVLAMVAAPLLVGMTRRRRNAR